MTPFLGGRVASFPLWLAEVPIPLWLGYDRVNCWLGAARALGREGRGGGGGGGGWRHYQY